MLQKYYGSLQYEKGRWVIRKLIPHVALRLKQLFPKIPISRSGPFYLHDQLDVAADLVWFCCRYPLEMSDKQSNYLNERADHFYQEQAKAEAILLPDYQPTNRTGLKEGQVFRSYQLKALDMIAQVKSLLLIDDIGLGKTYEALGIALLPDALPLVIVVEPHLQVQWVTKARSFIESRIHQVKSNIPYSLPPADIYIFKYTQLAPWVDVLTQGWVKAIAFDEVQQLRTGVDSAKGEAAQSICLKVPLRVGLTATPIYNYGLEAWSIANIIRPGLLGTREEFLREWCRDSFKSKGVVKDPDSLGAYLQEALLVLRRKKSDVGQEAKQRSPHVEWVTPNTNAVSDTALLAQQLAIKTLTADFTESGQAAREFDLKMREMTGIAKASQVAAFARMFVETGTPVILFGYHHEVYRIWEKELADLNPLFFTGKQTQSQKEKNKVAFLEGKSNILIMSLRSGAGTDGLQYRCSTVIIGEFDWSPKIHEQCIGRVDRDGQKNEVFTFYVATNFGSDPEIIDTIGLKESQSRGIIDPSSETENYQADVDRIKKLAEQYLQAQGLEVPERKISKDQISDEELVEII